MARVQPSSQETSRRMAKVRQTGTDAELALRRALFKRGLRYRVAYEILDKPRRTADVAFPGLKIAIFVDGCFWHGCPEHATWPKTNAEFWRTKIDANRRRDVDTNSRLLDLGWTVLRFWEHESASDSADIVARMVSLARTKRTASSDSLKNQKEDDHADGKL